MSASDAFRSNRLVWRFKKSGGNGRVLMAIADLDESVRARLIAQADVRDPEEPALGLLRSDDDWMLVTSRRIIWKAGDEAQEIALSALEGATIDAGDLHTAGRKDWVDVLSIVTTDGAWRLVLERGPPLIGMWNALRMAVRWRDRPQ